MNLRKLLKSIFLPVATLLMSVSIAKGINLESKVAKAEETEAVFRYFSLYHNSFNQGYDTLISYFNDGSKDIPVYESGITASELMNCLGSQYKINGKCVNEYTSGISFRGDIGVAKPALSISQSSGILKCDGTDVIEILAGTVFPNGATLKSTVSQKLIYYSGGSGSTSNSILVSTYEKVGDTNIDGIAFYPSFSVGAETQYMMINFVVPLPGSYKDSTTLFSTKFYLNGVSMREINAKEANTIQVLGWNQGGKSEKLYIALKTKILNLNGTDTFTFESGIVTPSLYETTETRSFLYYVNEYGTREWFPAIKDSGESFEIKNVSLFTNPAGNGLDMFYINFTKNIYAGNNQKQYTKSVYDSIIINGKTFAELRYLNSKTDIIWPDTGNQLVLYIPTNWEYGFKRNNKDNILILSDFLALTGDHIESEFHQYLYNGKWIDASEANEGYSIEQGTQDDSFTTAAISFIVGKECPAIDKNLICVDSTKLTDISNADAYWDDVDNSILRIKVPNSYLEAEKTNIIINKGFKITNSITSTSLIRILYYPDNQNLFIQGYVKAGTTKINGMAFYPNFNKDNATNNVMIDFSNVIKGDYSLSTEILSTHFMINGESMKDINNRKPNSIVVLGWNQGNPVTKLYVSLSTSLFKLDNTDMITFIKGIVTPSGYVTDETVSLEYDANSNVFTMFIEKTNEVELTSISVFPNSNPTHDLIYFTFSDVIALANVTVWNKYVSNFIFINGYSLGELHAMNNVDIIWGPQGYLNKIVILSKRGTSVGLKYNNADHFVIKEGFLGTNGAYITKTYDKIYYFNAMVDTSRLINDNTVSNCHVDDKTVSFDIDFLLGDGNENPNLEMVKFNDTKLSSIENASLAWKESDKSILQVSLPVSSLNDSGNVLSIDEGFAISKDLSTSKQINFKYYEFYKYWVEDDENIIFPEEELNVVSVGTPRIVNNGEFVVNVKFDRELTDIRLQGFTRDFNILVNETNNQEPGYYYTSRMIGFLAMYDMPYKALQCIRVNQIALIDMDYEQDNVYVSMYKNEIMIHILGTSSSSISEIENGLTIEILSGFRSYQGGQTSEDKAFTYDKANRKWLDGIITIDPVEPINPDSSDTSESESIDTSETTNTSKGCQGSIATCGIISIIPIVALALSMSKRKEN